MNLCYHYPAIKFLTPITDMSLTSIKTERLVKN